MLTITRMSAYPDKFRAYKIILDNNVVGEIRDGQSYSLEVPPGQHNLYLKIDWCTSNSIAFESDGTPVEFECGNDLRGLKLLVAILYVTVFANQYIWLRKKT
jgi:hypothetical protein